MTDNRTQSINEGEVRSALAHLLEGEGVPCPEDAYTAKVRARGSGGPLYVIIASPGMDAELGKVILAATARHRGSICGIWVLAERDASDLIRYSSAQ
jgi:hypothetical protein